MTYLFDPVPTPVVSVKGVDLAFPVGRIFCVGRNYEAHAAEMGFKADREAPFYFTKARSSIVSSGSTTPYPPGTSNFHYEMELVVAIGRDAFNLAPEEAMTAAYGYACGLDMTRRDLQLVARDKGRPWDLGKDFEQSAVVSEITTVEDFGEIADQRIWLKVNEETRQDQKLSDLIWSVPEIISDLSKFYHLTAGDLIYTGTPAGVGPVQSGDRIEGGVDGLESITLLIGPPE